MIGRLIDFDTIRIKKLFLTQAVCLWIGGAGPLLRYPLNWLFYIVSCYLQYVILVQMNEYFSGMRRKIRNTRDSLCIFILQLVVVAMFVVYPIAWAMCVELNWLSVDTEMILFANLDVSSKLLLTSVLKNLTMTSHQGISERQMWTFMNSLIVPSFVLDRYNKIIFWNTRMEELTGHRDVLYRPIKHLLLGNTDLSNRQEKDPVDLSFRRCNAPFYVLCNNKQEHMIYVQTSFKTLGTLKRIYPS
jgi:PAS domain-containing protein